MRRIPHNALLKALYTRLSAVSGGAYVIGCAMYDDVPDTATVPYATFGDFTCNQSNTKDVDMSEVTININIYSDYAGRKEVNTIANNILNQLEEKLVLDDNFRVVSLEVNFFEAYTEDMEGYNGVITLTILVQNMEASN